MSFHDRMLRVQNGFNITDLWQCSITCFNNAGIRGTVDGYCAKRHKTAVWFHVIPVSDIIFAKRHKTAVWFHVFPVSDIILE